MLVNLDKKLLTEKYLKWYADNPDTMHPLTLFLETLGLLYVKLYRNECWTCRVVDEQKFMLAKIKYGI